MNIMMGFQFDSLTVCFVGLFAEIEAVLVLIQLYKNNVLIKKFFFYKLASSRGACAPKSYTLMLLNSSIRAFVPKLELSRLASVTPNRLCFSSSGCKWIVGGSLVLAPPKMSYSILSRVGGYVTEGSLESQFLQ